ncbi:uncharacterized protein LOC128958514 [Oppia nitens]|uniref:uncharacterized protein LOC128958514 n=1 Tax=Oppia nitens TaxID=1686743 RepID=UPI0023DAD5FC|nr:uncharacterized protein LOC128958514 [Oppia nitens]XP_054160359.1 uncharacterized protein LOC128958514 [Oppia nitens]
MKTFLILYLSLNLFTIRLVLANVETSDTNEDMDEPLNQLKNSNASPFRKILNSLPGIRLGKIGQNINRDNIETLRQVIQASPQIDLQQLSTYTVPPVLEPNCYVEVQVIQRMPGKCTKLAGNVPACQAQDFISLDYNSCK